MVVLSCPNCRETLRLTLTQNEPDDSNEIVPDVSKEEDYNSNFKKIKKSKKTKVEETSESTEVELEAINDQDQADSVQTSFNWSVKDPDESNEENQSNKLKKKESNEKIEENGNAEGNKEKIGGLSRKELKKKRKHEKYLEKLENAQSEIVPLISMEEDNNSNFKKKKTKITKKNKLGESTVTEVALKAFNNVPENDVEQKKSKKRKLEVGNCGDTGGKKSTAKDQCQIDSVQTSSHWAEKEPDESNEEHLSPNKLKEKEWPVTNEKIEENGNAEGSKQKIGGLSRKELKRKRKHEKYLKELETAQSEIVPVISMEEDDNSNFKQKKRSTEVELEEFNDQDQIGSAQTSFDWSKVIVRVLESRLEKELSLKKLAKKVVNEYLTTVKPDHHTYEELMGVMAKFNKKLKKTKAVRVLGDRVKLVIK